MRALVAYIQGAGIETMNRRMAAEVSPPWFLDDTYLEPLGRKMPTIFVAGPAKSGSTFLWECAS